MKQEKKKQLYDEDENPESWKIYAEDEDRQKTMRDTKKLENMESMKSMERGTCHSLKKLLKNFLRGGGGLRGSCNFFM